VLHRTCWFTQVSLGQGGVAAAGAHTSHGTTSPATTLLALERTIQERREALAAGPAAPDEKPSWTAKLLSNPELLCKKVWAAGGANGHAHCVIWVFPNPMLQRVSVLGIGT
jgi:phosphoribosyl-ATP pyrophosphohydrolase/phosphoribosyl-AMP cyclohydrolase